MGKLKAVVTDVDGTITDRKRKLDIDSIKIIRDLGVKGIPTILASGNAYPVVLYLAKFIGTDAPVVAENGGIVAWDGKGIKKVLGSREAPRIFAERMEEKYPIRYLASDAWRESEVVIERNIDFHELSALAEKNGLKMEDTKFAYHIAQPHVRKLSGVREALTLMELAPRDVLAVGDSQNDMEMIKLCGQGAAVANATAEVLDIADYVAARSYGAGFVEIIHEFFPEV